ncbi:hypothetical protein COCON_G00003080 [Conger conger]|uniref:Ig-like domain-containing protein n=1 Tax=Conger conger TaxID=82655 RepID=A0A9Q1E1K8_CONCO|nr:hypothetical protein COCON_G00003080 [Conger conger]
MLCIPLSLKGVTGEVLETSEDDEPPSAVNRDRRWTTVESLSKFSAAALIVPANSGTLLRKYTSLPRITVIQNHQSTTSSSSACINNENTGLVVLCSLCSNEYQVSIDVQDTPATPMLSVSREVKAGEAVTATCTASHSCPTDLPHLSWSHTGTPIVQSEALPNGQWRVTSKLTFTATPSDHGRHLVCTAQYQQNKKVQCEKRLIVKYAPVNVEVETKSTVVKEGDAVKMQCSSESNPPAHSYQWYNITGALLSEEKIYKLDNVSRHISAFYCAANNTEGHRNSIPVKFRVEYPPRIGVESVCTAKITGVHCRCLVESSPTSRVQWILAGTVVNNSTVNSTGAKDSGTLHILHLPLGLTDMVSCNASNIHGNDILALQTNQRGVLMAIYLSGSAASAFVLIASILVLWKCSRRKKCVETRNNLYITASFRDGKRPSKDLCALEVDDDIYVNSGKTHFQDEEEEQHYGNCCQEDIYANM